MARALAAALFAAFAAAFVVLAVANRHRVIVHLDPFRFDAFQVSVPLYSVIVASMAAGIVIAAVVGAVSRRRRSDPRTLGPGAPGPLAKRAPPAAGRFGRGEAPRRRGTL